MGNKQSKPEPINRKTIKGSRKLLEGSEEHPEECTALVVAFGVVTRSWLMM